MTFSYEVKTNGEQTTSTYKLDDINVLNVDSVKVNKRKIIVRVKVPDVLQGKMVVKQFELPKQYTELKALQESLMKLAGLSGEKNEPSRPEVSKPA